MLTAMLDQRVSSLAYTETRQTRFLAEYRQNRADLEEALTRARLLVTSGEDEEREAIDVIRRRAGRWQARTEDAMRDRATPPRKQAAESPAREKLFASFRVGELPVGRAVSTTRPACVARESRSS